MVEASQESQGILGEWGVPSDNYMVFKLLGLNPLNSHSKV